MFASKLNNLFQQIVVKNNDTYYQDYLQAVAKVEDSTAIYHGKPVDFLYQALFWEKEDIEHLKGIIYTLIKILNKVIKEYKDNPDFRQYFPFPPLMEELILVDPGYQNPFPVARFDLFYNGDDSKFCELNTDGSSAMNEVRVIQKVMGEARAFKKLSKKTGLELQGFELFSSWLKTLLVNYREWGGKEEKPRIAIIDFEGEGTIYEFKEFKKCFQAHGHDTIICDPRELKYKDNYLYFQDKKIDIIYRRATTVRMVEEAKDIKDFINAYRDRKICVVGGLVSQVIHNKYIFALLHQEEQLPFLTKKEKMFIKKHIPWTHKLTRNTELIAEIKERKNDLLIKPLDRAASRGVYIGRDLQQDKWNSLIDEKAQKDYIVQEFVNPPQHPMAMVTEGNLHFEDFGFLVGGFLYNQELKGLYTRVGRKNIIGSIVECFTVPNYLVKRR